MRTIIAAAALALAGLAGFSPRAEAGLEIRIGFGQSYVSGHASCGCPIYTRRECRGFDRYRRPIFSYYRQPFQCGCKHKKHKKHPPGNAYGHYKDKKPKYHKHKHKDDKHFKSYKKAKKNKKCK